MKKIFAIIFVILIFVLTCIFFSFGNETKRVNEVISPTAIVLSDGLFKIEDLKCPDSYFSEQNKILAKNLNVSEEEMFILGNLCKYRAENLLKGRAVYLKGNSDLIYLKRSYKSRLAHSGCCIKDGKPLYKEDFEKRLNEIRNTKYKVLDLDTDEVFDISDTKVKSLKNYLVIKKIHLPRKRKHTELKHVNKVLAPTAFSTGEIKIFLTDLTEKIVPTHKCESNLCREILSNIDKAQKTIDIAIYGYSRVPEIEDALRRAVKRGVKIRLIYDLNEKGENIYPDTSLITSILPINKSDFKSAEAKNIMHNKFYIFDDKVLITGSANLSHTDMCGFNSNNIVVIKSQEVSKIYKNEFEQMFSGKFHNEKVSNKNPLIAFGSTRLQIFFSPQDKPVANAVLPLINKAEKYIYIPSFVLTDRKVTEALISAKKRGVDVKIIIDALNASVKHSKHNELRNNGILVKTENYAGKMHSKSMIVDDKYIIVGSMNFSYSGENKNDENLVLIENSEIAKFYKKFFLHQWQKIDDKWLKYNARAEGFDSIGSCYDGMDNNYDGLTDSYDTACKNK